MSQVVTKEMEETVEQEVQIVEQGLPIEDLPEIWSQYCEAGYGYVVKLRCFQRYWGAMNGLLVPQPGAVVLDGGCGTGAMFASILNNIKADKIVAVDYSEKMLEQARGTAAKLVNSSPVLQNIFEFKQRDLTQPFPWDNNSFDAQVYSIVLYYLPHHTWQQVLAEAYRTLKPGGYIYASIMFQGWDFPAMIKKRIPEEFLANPIRCLKAAKVKGTARQLQSYIEKGVIEYPTQEEFLGFLAGLGFRDAIQKEIFWGAGMAVRARK